MIRKSGDLPFRRRDSVERGIRQSGNPFVDALGRAGGLAWLRPRGLPHSANQSLCLQPVTGDAPCRPCAGVRVDHCCDALSTTASGTETTR